MAMNTKGYFFTTDAIIAAGIIIGITLATTVFYVEETSSADVHFLASDLITVLSTLTVGEVSNGYVSELIARGNITDLDNTILEQIGQFWAEGKDRAAENLSREIIGMVMPEGYSYGVWINDNETYNITKSEATQLFAYRRMISGIERAKPISGYTSTIFLNSIENRLTSSFAYFGGFVGEGNITRYFLMPTNFSETASIVGVFIEVDAGNDFMLYINDAYAGNFSVGSGGGSDMVPDRWQVGTMYHSLIHNGNNNITIVFRDLSSNYSDTNPDAIGGGFFQVRYFHNETEELGVDYDEDGNASTRFYLPGIEGLINLYDSFFISGELRNMSLYLRFKSNYTTFFNIGATNVVMTPPNDTIQEIRLDDEALRNIFNYTEISKMTIPLRMGHSEFAEGFGNGEADIILITDLSGSMDYDLISEDSGDEKDCSDPTLYEDDTQRLSLAKCLDYEFIDIILANPGNRIGLSGFYGDLTPPYKGRVYQEHLSDDADLLKAHINTTYDAKGGTCICCAINHAYKMLSEESNPNRRKFIIVMSDGIPTHTCQAASGCEGTRTGLPSKEGLWLGSAGCYGGMDDCETGDCDCATQNANWSSCRAKEDLNATVFSIGFGPVASCTTANKTLSWIADCGEGEYFASANGSLLRDIYQNISTRILQLSYENQSAVATGEFIPSILYPGSYIELNYTPIIEPPSYGKIPVTVEGTQFGNTYSNGTLYLPSSAELIDMRVCSYSGDKWTSLVTNEHSYLTVAYNLSAFGSSFRYLGDAFLVDVPVDSFAYGTENTVTTATGIIPINLTGGSPSNRIIYSVRIDRYINPGGVFLSVTGCNWTFELEDGSLRELLVPASYAGTALCRYTSAIHEYNTSVNSTDDGLQYGMFQIFDLFDFDDDGRVSVDLTENNLNITTYHQSGVPSMWGPAIAEVRVWK